MNGNNEIVIGNAIAHAVCVGWVMIAAICGSGFWATLGLVALLLSFGFLD